MILCDLISDMQCDVCPFKYYPDCEFSSKEVILEELDRMVELADRAMKVSEILRNNS